MQIKKFLPYVLMGLLIFMLLAPFTLISASNGKVKWRCPPDGKPCRESAIVHITNNKPVPCTDKVKWEIQENCRGSFRDISNTCIEGNDEVTISPGKIKIVKCSSNEIPPSFTGKHCVRISWCGARKNFDYGRRTTTTLPSKCNECGTFIFGCGEKECNNLGRCWWQRGFLGFFGIGNKCWFCDEGHHKVTKCKDYTRDYNCNTNNCGIEGRCKWDGEKCVTVVEEQEEQEYNKEFIISDEEFRNHESMTLIEIQNFLEERGSCLATYKTVDIDGAERFASAIIFNAAQKYHINPKVILTTLEKEQVLITSLECSEGMLDWAMGYAPGNEKWKGFAKQVDAAAWQFNNYWENLEDRGVTVSGWGVGIPKETEDGVTIIPKNKATACFYTYTPVVGHQWGGNDPQWGGNYLFYHFWYEEFGFS
jgi:hypothetical protein